MLKPLTTKRLTIDWRQVMNNETLLGQATHLIILSIFVIGVIWCISQTFKDDEYNKWKNDKHK